MEFKLGRVIVVVLLLSTIGCKTKKENGESYTKENYVLAYKNAILYGGINEKTNNEFRQVLNKYNNTASREVAILFHEIYNEAKLLGKNYSKNIKPYDSYGDLKGKLPIFSDCISYAFSKKADSIAKKMYLKTR